MRSLIRATCTFILYGSFSVASAQLPPRVVVDKYLIHAEKLHATKDYAAAFEVMQKIVAMQKEHNLTVSDDFHFKYAQVALSADSIHIALESVTRYLAATGKEGEFYKEALGLLVEAEESQISTEESCAGKQEGARCWKELANHPGCYVWNSYYYEDQTVNWSGTCSDLAARGEGTLVWTRGDESRSHTGVLRKGKYHGQWFLTISQEYGLFSEGPYLEGKKHGHWIEHPARNYKEKVSVSMGNP